MSLARLSSGDSTHTVQTPAIGGPGERGGPPVEELVQPPPQACHPSPTHLRHQQLFSVPPHPLSPHHCLPTGDGHRALSFFQQKGLRDFDTLLLSADGNTLYVGAREAILALNIQNPGIPRLRNMVRRPETKGLAGSEDSSCPGPALLPVTSHLPL